MAKATVGHVSCCCSFLDPLFDVLVKLEPSMLQIRPSPRDSAKNRVTGLTRTSRFDVASSH